MACVSQYPAIQGEAGLYVPDWKSYPDGNVVNYSEDADSWEDVRIIGGDRLK